MSWEWRLDAVLAQATEMNRDGALNATKSRIDGFPGRNTAGQIGNRGPPIAVCDFVNPNQIF